jgi:outer membrane lipoprotein-sorting protein
MEVRLMLLLLLLLSLVEPGVAMWKPLHSVLQSENDPRGVQILHRAQDAMGGTRKLASVRDTMHAMEITLEPAAGGYKMKQVSRFVAPDQFRSEQEAPFGRIVVYSDGKQGWITTPQGTNPLPADTLATARGVLFRQPSTLILSDRDPSRSVKAVGTDMVEVSSAEGETVRIEFDPATGLPLRQIYQIAGAGDRRVTRTETFSDWRDVDGLRFPFRAVQLEDGAKMLELVVSEYKVNTGLTAADLSKR